MKLYKCDRCGWIGVRENFSYLKVGERIESADAMMDICPGCRSELDAWIDGKACWKMDAEQTPAPPGTFEWVLARIRQGAPPETFRRSSWDYGFHLEVEGKIIDVSVNRRIVGFLDGYDILATDWEEIPKEGSE